MDLAASQCNISACLIQVEPTSPDYHPRLEGKENKPAGASRRSTVLGVNHSAVFHHPEAGHMETLFRLGSYAVAYKALKLPLNLCRHQA